MRALPDFRHVNITADQNNYCIALEALRAVRADLAENLTEIGRLQPGSAKNNLDRRREELFDQINVWTEELVNATSRLGRRTPQELNEPCGILNP